MKTNNRPHIISVGNLNDIVRANGNNNDDGNGWTRLVSDRRPPKLIEKGLLAVLTSRH
jgi:hypothetical protein